YPPEFVAGLHDVVGIDGLMAAVEGSGAQVDDAYRHVVARIRGTNDMVGHKVQGFAGKAFHGVGSLNRIRTVAYYESAHGARQTPRVPALRAAGFRRRGVRR